MKAKKLAEILMKNPDADVYIFNDEYHENIVLKKENISYRKAKLIKVENSDGEYSDIITKENEYKIDNTEDYRLDFDELDIQDIKDIPNVYVIGLK